MVPRPIPLWDSFSRLWLGLSVCLGRSIEELCLVHKIESHLD